jgi:integrase
VRDIDLQTRRIRVVEKGRRERVVPFGYQALRWVRRYLASAGLRRRRLPAAGSAGKALSRKRIDEVIKACARAAHETGHTLNVAAFGSIWHLLGNAPEESVPPFTTPGVLNAGSYGEMLAESHLPRVGRLTVLQWS